MLALRRAQAPVARTTTRVAARPLRSVVQVRAQKQQDILSAVAKPAVVAAVANAFMAMPALASTGKIFDFNATLPLMAAQFLLLMVFLDKTWFGPVGKVLDERDAMIRDKLSSVKDNSGDVDKLAAEAQSILKAARQETTNMINEKKTAKQGELDKQYNDAKSKVTGEVEASIKALDNESKGMLAKLDAQVDKISAEVLRRVLPDGVRI